MADEDAQQKLDRAVQDFLAAVAGDEGLLTDYALIAHLQPMEDHHAIYWIATMDNRTNPHSTAGLADVMKDRALQGEWQERDG
jgi:hypothetical protein